MLKDIVRLFAANMNKNKTSTHLLLIRDDTEKFRSVWTGSFLINNSPKSVEIKEDK